jgi:hypothetical protein
LDIQLREAGAYGRAEAEGVRHRVPEQFDLFIELTAMSMPSREMPRYFANAIAALAAEDGYNKGKSGDLVSRIPDRERRHGSRGSGGSSGSANL